MSEEILNEVIEETVDTTVEETDTSTEEIIETPQRVNAFCVIAKDKWANGGRDIQTNASWGKNPYGEAYAVVPDDMVVAIQETKGFCDIELNEDETEVVSFTALEIPEFPVPEPEPTQEERIAELEESVIASEIAITELDLKDIETQQALTDMDIRLMALEV